MSKYRGFITLSQREMLRFLTLPNQTILPAVVSTVLYIVVFGSILGTRIQPIDHHNYIVFVFPGLLLMGVAFAAFQNTSTSLFMARWEHFIDDLLVAPISYLQMVTAFIVAATVRGLITGVAILVSGVVFLPMPMEHPMRLALILAVISMVFAASGIVAGLWAQRWDNIAIIMNYILTPMIFLGGVFYSTAAMPERFRWTNQVNPLYYMVTGVRFGFFGEAESPFWISMAMSCALAVFFTVWAVQLFRRGYNLRT